ncbi:MAG: hypothetical protein ACSHWS_10940 [Sulfitobacter sp.]
MPTITIYHKTVLRLWHNPRFGQGIGPKQINRFVFNGSITFPSDDLRLHADMAALEHFPVVIDPKNSGLFEQLIVELCDQLGWTQAHIPNVVMGQLFELVDRQKHFVDGAVFFNTQTNQCVVLMFDDERGMHLREQFPLNHCFKDKQGKKSPDYFGSNFELEPAPVAQKANVTGVLSRLDANRPTISTS